MTGCMKPVWAEELIFKIYISAGTIMQSFLSVLMILTADILSWLSSSLTFQYSSITCFYWIVANQSKSATPFPSFSCFVCCFNILQFWDKANNLCLVRHSIQLFPWNCQMRKILISSLGMCGTESWHSGWALCYLTLSKMMFESVIIPDFLLNLVYAIQK